MAKAQNGELNPKSTSYEFLGPPGALFITITVPAFTYALYFGCSEQAGGCHPPIDTDLIVSSLSDLNWWKGIWDTEAAIAYLGWYAFTVAAWAILPGDWVSGTVMRNGQTKQYKINGTHPTWSLPLPLDVHSHARRVASLCNLLPCHGHCGRHDSLCWPRVLYLPI